MAIEPRCSFCGKFAPQVEWLLSGPKEVYICSECVEAATTQIAKIREKKALEQMKEGEQDGEVE